MKCDGDGVQEGEGRRWEDRGAPPSRNPGYAHDIRLTYGKMTYAHCMYVIGKKNVSSED